MNDQCKLSDVVLPYSLSGELSAIADPSGRVKESVDREKKLEKGVYDCLRILETSILEGLSWMKKWTSV